MCGIAGIVVLGNSEAPSSMEERLATMAGCMHHRGPDDGGVYVCPQRRAGLANRRLAIRDLSPAGHMPMSNADETLTLTYNGELYNADELRTELEGMGYRFRSHSDTEAILHGYAAWGEKVVSRLRGMFAFALWDSGPSAGPGGKLFIARDRLGIKPLYYAHAQADGVFLFASEIKALLSTRLLKREISSAGLVGYLMMGSVPNPLTIYRDVKALEPGCTLSINPANGEIGKQRYWSLPTDEVEEISYKEAVESVRALLEEAVRIRLVSDVPLGAFLSSGLDSSAVVGLMRKATTGVIRTCSMIFEEAEYSEARYAKAMAEQVGAEHYRESLKPRPFTGCGEAHKDMHKVLLSGIVWV